jgi:plasmid maintenance system antidote protein VapI
MENPVTEMQKRFGLSQTAFAKVSGIDDARLNELLAGVPTRVDDRSLLKLSMLSGCEASVIQKQYRTWRHERMRATAIAADKKNAMSQE